MKVRRVTLVFSTGRTRCNVQLEQNVNNVVQMRWVFDTRWQCLTAVKVDGQTSAGTPKSNGIRDKSRTLSTRRSAICATSAAGAYELALSGSPVLCRVLPVSAYTIAIALCCHAISRSRCAATELLCVFAYGLSTIRINVQHKIHVFKHL